MHQLQEHHWKVVKRILHYLAGIPHNGILLKSSSNSTILDFSDADWRSNLDDNRSTRGF